MTTAPTPPAVSTTPVTELPRQRRHKFVVDREGSDGNPDDFMTEDELHRRVTAILARINANDAP